MAASRPDGSFGLLDGDRIAALAAQLLGTLTHRAGINLKIGVVQTAYANGSSTAYIEKTLVRRTLHLPMLRMHAAASPP